MVQVVLTGLLTVLGLYLGWFSSLSSKYLCLFDFHGAIYIQIIFFCYILFTLPFNELSLVGLALDLVD